MFTFASDADGTIIHVHEWAPAAAPRGIVQLSHGMGEHAARYAHVAETLAADGFAVYADDHRGHGLSIAGDPGDLGPGGWDALVADMVQLSGMVKDRHPELPLVLVGHSMGSFASQQYILDHSDLIAGVALSGTAAVDELLPLLSAADTGDSGGSALAAFNTPFEPGRTGFEWLSRDDAQVDTYVADPLCGFDLAPAAMGQMFAAAGRWADVSSVRPDLPIYVFVGDQDPVNGRLVFSTALVRRYRDTGHPDVTYRTYPGARHEILNETNRDEVEADLLAFLNRVV